MERIQRIAAHLGSPQQTQGSQVSMQTTAGFSAEASFKVAVLGAAGGIGQPLALLMKMNPLVRELSLYDVVGTEGVAADISHINSRAQVSAHTGPESLSAALHGCDLVIIPAGVPRKPGMSRDDLFNINAGIVKTLAEGCARYCPKAIINIISNPVNSTVPIAAEVLKKAGVYDPRRLMGVTKLDVVRANAFIAEAIGKDPADVSIPVIGGHAGITILPLLSQATPRINLPADKVKALTARIQDAGTEVVKAKAGKGSATLSMAYAAAKFGESCLLALAGRPAVVECAYVESHLTPLPFFASRVVLGPQGVQEYLPLGQFSQAEASGFESLKAELQGSIKKGVDFVHSGPKSS